MSYFDRTGFLEMDYFTKIEEKPKNDLLWNIPEKKQGIINIIGGSSQNFKTEIRVAEFVNKKYPVETVNLVLPDALKNSLPDLPNFCFLPSTGSGSFAESREFLDIFNVAEFNLVLGDFSKNSVTSKVVSSAYEGSEKMSLITRDGVDIIAEFGSEKVLANDNIFLLASMPQLTKLLRAIYYPKMLLLSQSLMQVVEILHKFTISYSIGIITLHNGQILIIKDGKAVAVALAKSGYSPLSIWRGELAAKIAAINLYNPNNFLDATICAIFS